jgi:predicted nucleotidyltransferase
MSEVLTPKVMSILRAMYANLGKWYYTRELAKLANVSTWAVSKPFARLVEDEMVRRRSEGREKFYRLNLLNAKTRKICELFETERRERFFKENRRLAWILEDFTKRASEFVPGVQSAVLFGSTARGQATPRSDVDVMILVPNYEGERFKNLMSAVDRLASEVSGRHTGKLVPVVMTMRDFEQSLKDNKRFATDVLKDGVVLYGEERYYHLLSKVI